MKIGFQNNIYFSARKPEIRKADDIQRRARAEFPMLSSSYANDFYVSVGKGNRITQKKQSLFSHLCDCVEKTRNGSSAKIIPHETYVPYVRRLNAVKKNKTGNCMEAAMATATALLANGYKNTSIGNLLYEAKFLDKKTGETVYSGTISLDHSFVMTDMNKCGERNIIVDSWLGFADSKEGAIARYKQIKDEKVINNAICNIARELYSDYKMPIEDILDDYTVKGRMLLKENRLINNTTIWIFSSKPFSYPYCSGKNITHGTTANATNILNQVTL